MSGFDMKGAFVMLLIIGALLGAGLIQVVLFFAHHVHIGWTP